jgi:hypothetical protein
MRLAWVGLVAAVVVMSANGAAGQTKTETFEMNYSNPGITPSHWTLILYPDGSGHFSSHGGEMAGGGSDIKSAPVDRNIQVSEAFAARVFETAYKNRLFNVPCQSRLKVAFQGWKTLKYSGPRGTGSCTFNYSQNKAIESLGNSLVAVEQTIMEGARLEALLRYDPLGLDREMSFLVKAVKNGQAQQICVIRGILTQLAGDPKVLDRVRRWADELLSDSKTSPPA